MIILSNKDIKTFINRNPLRILSASWWLVLSFRITGEVTKTLGDSRDLFSIIYTNMKSKTQIEKQLERKTNPELVKTIINAKKKEKWLEVAMILSSPRINKININLGKIDEKGNYHHPVFD